MPKPSALQEFRAKMAELSERLRPLLEQREALARAARELEQTFKLERENAVARFIARFEAAFADEPHAWSFRRDPGGEIKVRVYDAHRRVIYSYDTNVVAVRAHATSDVTE